MKSLFQLSILCLTICANAQNYDSFFGESETHVICIHDDGTLGEDPRFLDSLSITTEVISVAGEVLKKVDRFKYGQTESLISFYYREDLEEGKLWYRPSVDAEEHLVADLSLEVGDPTDIFFPFFNATVSEIAYVDDQKVIYFDTSWHDPIFIKEGVLPMMFAEQVTLPEGFEYFFTYFTVCVQKDGDEVFRIDEIWDLNLGDPNNNWVTCELIDIQNLDTQSFNKNQILVYPNPTSDYLSIESKQFEIEAIEIFNLQGKRLIKTEINASNQVDVSNLSQGVYFIQFSRLQNTIINKFVKK